MTRRTLRSDVLAHTRAVPTQLPALPEPDFLTLVAPGSLDYRRDQYRPRDPARRLRPRGATQGLPSRKGGHRRGQRPLRPADSHPISARAQRLPAHRARQVHLPQLRHRRRVRGPLQSAVRRHQPDHRGRPVRRGHPERRPLARVRVERGALRQRLLRAAVRDRRAAGPGRQGVRGFPERGGYPGGPWHGDGARYAQSVP